MLVLVGNFFADSFKKLRLHFLKFVYIIHTISKQVGFFGNAHLTLKLSLSHLN